MDSKEVEREREREERKRKRISKECYEEAGVSGKNKRVAKQRVEQHELLVKESYHVSVSYKQ